MIGALLLAVPAGAATGCTSTWSGDGTPTATASGERSQAAVPRPAARADAAAFASDVLAAAVELGSQDRSRWLSAHVTPQTLPQVRDFLDEWVRRLGGGDALPGVTDPRLALTTLAYDTDAVRPVAGGEEVDLMLVQRLSRSPEAGPGGTAYLRTQVVVRDTAQGLLLVRVVDVLEVPEPSPVVLGVLSRLDES